MSDSLTVQQNAGLELFRGIAQRQEEIIKETVYTYPSAYARVLHPSSEKASDFAPGTLQISWSRDEQDYSQVLAVLPVDVIGTSGQWDSKNPTPRNWPTDFSQEQTAKYGNSLCRSGGNFRPDPVITQNGGRVLTHPQANNRQFVKASKGYKSKEVVDVPTMYHITADTDCRDCPFGKPWFTVADEEGKSNLVLSQACRPNPAGVFYLVGAMGKGRLPKSQRSLLQVHMFKQATRTMFNNDAEFQKKVGIFAPMESVIKAKPLDVPEIEGMTIPANAVYIKELGAVLSLPLLIGGILHVEEVGKSAIPFVYNPANKVREYLRTSSESDIGVKLQKAVTQAVEEFASRIKLMDVQHGKQQIYDLLQQTTVVTTEAATLALQQEYNEVFEAYHREEDGMKVGRAKLTTPFQTVERTIEPTGDTANAPEAQADTADYTKAKAALDFLSSMEDFSFSTTEEEKEEVSQEPPVVIEPPHSFFNPAGWGNEND